MIEPLEKVSWQLADHPNVLNAVKSHCIHKRLLNDTCILFHNLIYSEAVFIYM